MTWYPQRFLKGKKEPDKIFDMISRDLRHDIWHYMWTGYDIWHDISHDISNDKWHDLWNGYDIWPMTWHLTRHITWHITWHVKRIWHLTWNIMWHVTWPLKRIRYHITWYIIWHITWQVWNDIFDVPWRGYDVSFREKVTGVGRGDKWARERESLVRVVLQKARKHTQRIHPWN